MKSEETNELHKWNVQVDANQPFAPEREQGKERERKKRKGRKYSGIALETDPSL